MGSIWLKCIRQHIFLLNVSPCWSKFWPTRAHDMSTLKKVLFAALISLLCDLEDSSCTQPFSTLHFMARSMCQKGLIASAPIGFDILGSLVLDCSRGELVNASKLIHWKRFQKEGNVKGLNNSWKRWRVSFPALQRQVEVFFYRLTFD